MRFWSKKQQKNHHKTLKKGGEMSFVKWAVYLAGIWAQTAQNRTLWLAEMYWNRLNWCKISLNGAKMQEIWF